MAGVPTTLVSGVASIKRSMRVESFLGVPSVLAMSLALLTPEPSMAQTNLPTVTVDAPRQARRAKPAVVNRPVRARTATAVRRPARAPVAARPVSVAAPAAAPVPTPPPTPSTGVIGNPPPAFAGGQVARGGRLGLLGNRDFMSTPFTQMNFTEKLIKDQQAITAADVLVNDPSVRATVSPFSYQDNFRIRGFTLNSRDFAYDGLYGVTNNRRPDLTGVERVEVLHGPAAFLFGLPPTGSIAGIVNLVPKRAGDVPTREISLNYLSRSNVGGTFDVGQRFGDQNQFGIRVNGSYQDGATPISNQSFEKGSLTLGMDYRGDRFRLSVDAGYTHLGENAPSNNSAVLPGIVIPRAPSLTLNYQQPWEFANTNHVYGLVRAEYDIAPLVTVFGAFGASSIYERFRQTVATISNSAGTFTASPLVSGGLESQKTAETGIRAKFDTGFIRHSVSLTGTGYWQEYPFASNTAASFTSNIYMPIPVVPRVIGPLSAFAPAPIALYGIAAADTMTLFGDHLDLIGGVRHQWVSQNQYSFTSPLLNTYNNKTAVTPLGAAVFRPIKPLSFYASYAEGLGIGPIAPTAAVNAGQVFAPVKSKQIEAGAKVDLGTIGASLSFFEITQAFSFTNPTTKVFAVDGQQRNRGVEFNVFGSPIEGVRVIGGFSLMKGTLLRTAGGTYDGKEAPGVPRAAVSLSGEYDIPFVPGLTATGRVIYTSGQYYDQANTQAIPNWTRLDLGARYSYKLADTTVTARLNVENVTGLNYWASTGNGTLALGTPRNVRFSVSASF